MNARHKVGLLLGHNEETLNHKSFQTFVSSDHGTKGINREAIWGQLKWCEYLDDLEKNAWILRPLSASLLKVCRRKGSTGLIVQKITVKSVNFDSSNNIHNTHKISLIDQATKNTPSALLIPEKEIKNQPKRLQFFHKNFVRSFKFRSVYTTWQR